MHKGSILFEICAALLAVQLVSAPLWAQPASAPATQPALVEMPMGKAIQTPQGRLQGFTLDEFKLLLRVHTDYRAWGRQVPLLQLQVKELSDLAENRKLQINLLREEKETLEQERARLLKKWHDENEKRLLCEAKPALGSWIAWGVAALAAVTAAVLAGVVISK